MAQEDMREVTRVGHGRS